MATKRMERKAADNAYLHKDFHGALSHCLIWLEEERGPGAVREYLRRFAAAWYAPLSADIARRGLAAVREHIENVYRAEGAAITARASGTELLVKIPACPAVAWMRANNMPVAPLFVETTRTVYRTVCEGTGVSFELLRYDPETGAAALRFRKEPA